jgi:hypothetical protein
MQYTGRLQIAKGNQQKPFPNRMRHLYPPVLRLCAVLLLPGLSACAAVEDSPLSSKQLQRQYDKTLTKTEQQAVISDLQGATTKKEGENGEKEGDSGADNDPSSESDNTN